MQNMTPWTSKGVGGEQQTGQTHHFIAQQVEEMRWIFGY